MTTLQEKNLLYSQSAIKNINKILKHLKNKLDSVEKNFNNYLGLPSDLYTVNTLVAYIEYSLSVFNLLPIFSEYTFDDVELIENIGEGLADNSFIMLLATQSLIEIGKVQFTLFDNKIEVLDPDVSERYVNSYTSELQVSQQQLKLIKSKLQAI